MKKYVILALNHFVKERKVEGWRRATWFVGVWKECEQIGVRRRSTSRYVVDCVRRNWSVLGQGSREIASTKRVRQETGAGRHVDGRGRGKEQHREAIEERTEEACAFVGVCACV